MKPRLGVWRHTPIRRGRNARAPALYFLHPISLSLCHPTRRLAAGRPLFAFSAAAAFVARAPVLGAAGPRIYANDRREANFWRWKWHTHGYSAALMGWLRSFFGAKLAPPSRGTSLRQCVPRDPHGGGGKPRGLF